MQISKLEILAELRKCQDPVHFIKNHVYITHPMRGRIHFDLFPYQQECLEIFDGNRFTVVLKARQLGLSTLMSAYILWYLIFKKDKEIVVLSRNREEAAELVRKIKYAFQALPSWIVETLKLKIVLDNVHTLSLSTNSRVNATATTEDAGRGRAVSLFILDEAAFIEKSTNMEELWKAVYAAVSAGGSIIVNSTPLGVGWYYDLYQAATEKRNQFVPIRLPWSVHPERDDAWAEQMKSGMSKYQWASEYDCNFLLSGETVVDVEDINFLRNTIEEPLSRESLDRALWTWNAPEHGHKYLLVADVSAGHGEDFSALVIIDIDKQELAAEFKGKIKTDLYGELIVALGLKYNKALIVVENNSMGVATLNRIISTNYPNLFYYDKNTKQELEGYVDDNSMDLIPGFTTNTNNRPQLIEKLEFYLRNRILKCKSSRLVLELESFIWHNNKAQAKKGKNDDLVLTYAIACYILHKLYKKTESVVGYNSLTMLQNNHTQIGITIEGMPGHNIQSAPYEMRDNNGNKHDLRWLIKKDKVPDERPLQKSIFGDKIYIK
jgi:hypothetical protein